MIEVSIFQRHINMYRAVEFKIIIPKHCCDELMENTFFRCKIKIGRKVLFLVDIRNKNTSQVVSIGFYCVPVLSDHFIEWYVLICSNLDRECRLIIHEKLTSFCKRIELLKFIVKIGWELAIVDPDRRSNILKLYNLNILKFSDKGFIQGLIIPCNYSNASEKV